MSVDALPDVFDRCRYCRLQFRAGTVHKCPDHPAPGFVSEGFSQRQATGAILVGIALGIALWSLAWWQFS